MSKHEKIQMEKLAALEREFRDLLIPCLKQCANGRWGLFGAYDKYPELRTWIHWPEKERLHELASSIHAIHEEFGGIDPLCEEFLNQCTLHGANDPGEPKLAKSFLTKIQKRDGLDAQAET